MKPHDHGAVIRHIDEMDWETIRWPGHRRHALRTGHRRVEIEVAQRSASIGDFPERQAIQAFEQRLGLGAAVRLDIADHHALALLGLGRLQHRVGLAHARRGTEEHRQLAAFLPRLLALHAREERVGVGAGGGH